MTDIIPSLELEDLIRTETRPVLIDLYADWCGPCRMLAPLIDQLATALADHVRVVKMKSDDDAPTATGGPNPLTNFMAAANIRSIPTLALFENGQYRGIYQGTKTTDAITSWMETTLGRKLDEPSAAPPLSDYAIVFDHLTGTTEDKIESIKKFFNQESSPELPKVFAAQRARIVGLSVSDEGDGRVGLVFRTTEDVAREIARIVPDKPVTGPLVPPQP